MNISATSATGTLQTETSNYQARILAAGGTIDARTLAAVDEFVWTGKRDGWWTLLDDVGLFLGNNLAAALVKLKAATAATSLISANFVEADYSQAVGFGPASSNTNKWLDLGFDPASVGISLSSYAFGLFIADRQNSTNSASPIMGLMPTVAPSAESGVYVGIVAGAQVGNLSSNAGRNGWRTVLATGRAGSGSGITEGIVQSELIATTTGTAPTGGNVSLFVSKRFNQTIYTNGKIGGYVVGRALTAAQGKSLCLALAALNQAISRPRTLARRAVFFGDSVTNGYITTDAYNGNDIWPELVCRATGYTHINAGVPSSQLRQSAGAVVGGFQRYTDILALKPELVVITYGENDANIADVTTNGDATIIADYKTKLTAIANAFRAAGIQVQINSLPYYTAVSATKIQAYSVAAKEAAQAAGATFCDIYHIIPDTGSPASYVADAFHPNTAGHALLARAVLAGLRGQRVRKPTLDFPSIAAGAQASLTVTVWGAAVGDSGFLGPPAALEAGLVADALVTASDTVTMRLTNTTGGAIDPASAQWGVTVLAQ